MSGQAAEVIAGAIGGLGSLVKTGFDIYNNQYQQWANQRDFDYQNALQREVFQREDTAVQRRMRDLQAAGLNPNLAAGSAASSGAVVGRNSTAGLGSISGNSIGTALDAMTAVQQLRNIKEQNEILKNEKQVQKYNAFNKELETQLNIAETYKMLGFNPIVKKNEFGLPKVYLNGSDNKPRYLSDTPFGEILSYQLQNQKNSADMLQKDVDFYTADKLVDYFGAGVSAFTGIGSGLNSYGIFNRYYRR